LPSDEVDGAVEVPQRHKLGLRDHRGDFTDLQARLQLGKWMGLPAEAAAAERAPLPAGSRPASLGLDDADADRGD
jgi:hypothetical protein